ncbi:MAG: YbhB/YbcL family Raf kinase inhibitor-like protein [Candidatus Diapherotrites archaeon]|nr:YbhB/YbcL family Raf kinase inhibitor-like protein [Candidatus Diapherotrites archaeon]
MKAWHMALLLLLAGCVQQEATGMKITSTAFRDMQPIPAKYTCDGNDMSPPLDVSGAPEGTKSLALIVDDPDAPVGVWVHWVVWNLPAASIPENSLPAGALQGMNSFSKLDYGGPCPPSGRHRYFFKLYALDTKLDLEDGSSEKDLEMAMNGHILAEAQLIGTYER